MWIIICSPIHIKQQNLVQDYLFKQIHSTFVVDVLNL